LRLLIDSHPRSGKRTFSDAQFRAWAESALHTQGVVSTLADVRFNARVKHIDDDNDDDDVGDVGDDSDDDDDGGGDDSDDDAPMVMAK
jgi:hypothetical protein